jgi:hypothetical protein
MKPIKTKNRINSGAFKLPTAVFYRDEESNAAGLILIENRKICAEYHNDAMLRHLKSFFREQLMKVGVNMILDARADNTRAYRLTPDEYNAHILMELI